MNNPQHTRQFNSRFDELTTIWGGAALSAFIRCYVAWQFLKSGILKIQNWPSTLELFHDEYHVPLIPPEVAAYFGTAGELVFPCFLIVGLFSRPAALGLFLVNAVAVMSYPQIWEYECPAAINDHFYWGLLLLVVIAFGAGRFSIDAVLKKILAKVAL